MHTLFVISAPSGCGKTSLIKALRTHKPELKLSISHTTRTIREGEQDGVDYFFVDTTTFASLKANNTFVESANVFGNLYGTSKDTLHTMLTESSVIVEIDWQGARQIRDSLSNVVSIFIMPPSIDTLRDRLTARGDDSETIDYRMNQAEAEISHKDEYDHIIINDDFSTASTELDTIISKYLA